MRRGMRVVLGMVRGAGSTCRAVDKDFKPTLWTLPERSSLPLSCAHRYVLLYFMHFAPYGVHLRFPFFFFILYQLRSREHSHSMCIAKYMKYRCT